MFLLIPMLYKAYGQTDTTALVEVVISATKFNTQLTSVAQKIDVIGAKSISNFNAQNTGDLLISTGNIFVQKSQQGGSSPVIRGFEASRVLLVVDGVRMNNAIYRAGHLQNAITVDQNMLDRVEVMYGPSSTLYGSDALGGSLHFITKPVSFAAEGEKTLVSGSGFVRYSSANNEQTGHADINIAGKKLGFLTSFTYSDFADMKMGRNYPDKYPDFGRRSQYIETQDNPLYDTVMNNSDDRKQLYSGYRQWDFMQKIAYKQSDRISHLLNIQLSNSTDIPRYDRLQDVRNGNLRYAEWYYGPQKRNFFSYSFNMTNVGVIADDLRISVSLQDIAESRQQRDYRRYDRMDSRREKLKVWGIVADARKKFGNNELTYGVDAQLNSLSSVADRTDLLTGEISALDTRYPDGDNNMNYFALYAQHVFHFGNGKWTLNDGLRLQTVNLHSNIINNSFFELPVTDMKYNLQAITGNLGLVYRQTNWKASLNLSSGFRAPNIDDLARVFESSSDDQSLVIPNAGIKPEYTYNADLGLAGTINRWFEWEASAFYTTFRNAITLAPYQLNGQDSIVYNGTMSQVIANQNLNKAYLYGFNARIKLNITPHLSLSSTLSYMRGRYKTDPEKTSSIYEKQSDGTYSLVDANVSERPMDHIPPLYGLTSITYTHKNFRAECYGQYNGWKKLDDYNSDGEDNPQYATADGMPSWFTLNARTSYQFTKNLQLQAAIENITDRNYRYFASGFSAAGRNLILCLRANF